MVMADLLNAEKESLARDAQSISTAELHWINTIFSEGNPVSLTRILQKMNALVEFQSAALLAGVEGKNLTCQASGGMSLREVRESEDWLNGPGREAWETAEKPRIIRREDDSSESRGTVLRGPVLIVPLRGRAGRLGVLLMTGAANASFSRRDVHLISLLAAQISVRIENRSLEDRENHRSSRIEDLLGRANIPHFLLSADGTVLRANRAFRDLIGACGDDAVIPNFFDGLVHPPEEGPRLRHLVRNGEVVDNMELQLRRADGTLVRVVLGSQAVKGPDGVITTHEAVLKDVTSMKIAAERIVQNQAMASVGQMTYNIAHDFNNLITGIMGCASMMMSRLEPDHPMAEDLQAVVSASVKASDLAGHLLAYSRGESRPSKVVRIGDIVTETLRIIRNLFDERVAVVWTPDPSVPAIRGDATRIQQAVMNICLNARDAMPDGGRLVLETESVSLMDGAAVRFGVEPGEYVLLRIGDSGCGMDRRTLKRVFEPYFTTKGDQNGNGLGLAITLEAVRMHHGGIAASSRKGIGTVFEMVFPVHRQKSAPAAAAAPAADPALPRGSETVLFVDDEEVIRRMGKRILEKFGYRVLMADAGEEAVRIAKEDCSSIDLMIIDRVMPGMDGAETLKRVRSHCPNMKALLTSGYGLQDAEAPGRDGFLGFLPKPFMMEQMLQLIRRSLDGLPAGGPA
jgi:two-component system, cell cycle sensor histidine kinase and response regulator CckA